MAAIDFPIRGASRHHRRALIALAVAMLFGLLTLAAVRAMRVDCRTQYQLLDIGGYIRLNDGGRIPLDNGRQQCEVVMGDIKVPLPAWAQAIIGR